MEKFSSSPKSIQAISYVTQVVAYVCWCFPLVTIIKINVNVVFCGDMCFLGVVAQNWHRVVLKLLTKRNCIIMDEVAKAKAIVLAL